MLFAKFYVNKCHIVLLCLTINEFIRSEHCILCHLTNDHIGSILSLFMKFNILATFFALNC